MCYLWLSIVIPSGLEPKSSEPESDILSIELWDLKPVAKLGFFLYHTKYIRCRIFRIED
jgi:hypothetical protein